MTGIRRGRSFQWARTSQSSGSIISASACVISIVPSPFTGCSFTPAHWAVGDDVAIVRNEHGVELNLIFNANAGDPDSNILMDVPDKFAGYTHMALRVVLIPATITALNANDIAITQGPVSFGQSGQVSVFVRDPDRNVIELRGRERGVVEGVTRYVP